MLTEIWWCVVDKSKRFKSFRYPEEGYGAFLMKLQLAFPIKRILI